MSNLALCGLPRGASLREMFVKLSVVGGLGVDATALALLDKLIGFAPETGAGLTYREAVGVMVGRCKRTISTAMRVLENARLVSFDQTKRGFRFAVNGDLLRQLFAARQAADAVRRRASVSMRKARAVIGRKVRLLLEEIKGCNGCNSLVEPSVLRDKEGADAPALPLFAPPAAVSALDAAIAAGWKARKNA